MLGDASIGGTSSGNPFIQVEMSNKRFLDWINNKLGVLATNVRTSKNKEELAKRNFDEGYSPNCDPEKYEQPYRLETRRMPTLDRYEEWYINREDRHNRKIFPNNINITPLLLSVWFCCDGSKQYQTNNVGSPYIVIYASSHGFEKNKIISWFNDLPYEPRWQDKYGLRFTVEDSVNLWNYMGPPLPGFEYKWPDNYSK